MMLDVHVSGRRVAKLYRERDEYGNPPKKQR